jgi:hypothetical protein
MIPQLLENITWSGRFSRAFDVWPSTTRRKFDTAEARETMKAIRVLAMHGAKWMPKDRKAIAEARRPLLQMTSDYTVEFVWIMSKYRACDLTAVRELLATPTMKANIAPYQARLRTLLALWS